MSRQTNIRLLLAEGDRRSVGRVDEVVEKLKRRPENAGTVVECLFDADAGVRMRAADALEKASREQNKILQPYREQLLALSAETAQPELRWHLALMLPRLPLSAVECAGVAAQLEGYLQDRSSIVKTFALQGLADLIRQAPDLRGQVIDLIRLGAKTGTPAMQARARKLLRQLENDR